MRKDIGLAASNFPKWRDHIQYFKDSGKLNVHNLPNYFHAKDKMGIRKYDLILLDPVDFSAGIVDAKTLDKSSQFYGMRLLDDILKGEESINKKTPVYVVLDSDKDFGDGFSQEDYINKGADKVILFNIGQKPMLEVILEGLK